MHHSSSKVLLSEHRQNKSVPPRRYVRCNASHYHNEKKFERWKLFLQFYSQNYKISKGSLTDTWNAKGLKSAFSIYLGLADLIKFSIAQDIFSLSGFTGNYLDKTQILLWSTSYCSIKPAAVVTTTTGVSRTTSLKDNYKSLSAKT